MTLQMLFTPQHVYQGTWTVVFAGTVTGGSLLSNLSGPAINDSMGINLDITPGTWTVAVWCAAGPSGGVLTFELSTDNGGTWASLGTSDMYNAASTARLFTATGVVVAAGVSAGILRVRSASKNASSTNYLVGVSQVGLLKTG